ncbi:hypothetical protein GOBAR_AA35840 [Gossypium barbadense]|uniref:Mechanosensitive ion channel protein n=1 Tax=Gossypium barbadense TaxID=3634 RepID=A0A2P5W1A5_GOSBA|nr:hypothetical protein GOBAR_AA35840 [Gossypium barbadense]
MTVDTADRKETIVKVDDRSNKGSIAAAASDIVSGGGGKFWRESSYDFLQDSGKISTDCAMEDPPSKLIGQFLHKQKASGEISLDMDLEMDELQQQPPDHGGSLPTVAESPSPSATTFPRVSFENNPLRRRQSKGSPLKEQSDGVVKCSSNSSLTRSEGGSFKRKSNLLVTKTKSRLIDPPTPEKGEPRSARVGTGKSGRRSGFLGKTMEEEEDDPWLEEDLPDEIQDSLFNQYVIESLSGPPLIEIQRAEEEEERLANEVMNLQNAGAKVPSGLKTSTISSPLSARTIGSGRILKSPRGRSPRLSRVLSSENGEKDDMGITIDHLHKLNHKNVSAWNMKRLMNIVRHGALSTLDEKIQDSTHEDEAGTHISNEREAKVATRKIFQNVAKPGSKFIYLEDIGRFLQEDEALKTMSLFEDAFESRRISKKSLKNWVVNAFRERRALAFTLNDTKTAVNRLHRIVDAIVGIVIVVIWLLILEIATSKVLVFISSQLLLVAFVFGNTCKTVFEAIIFLFVMHPFDVGDRCEIDGIQMVVEEMNILTTIFLRYDNQKIMIPNSVLATKAIHNYYRSPDMGDAVEFCIHVKTPADNIGLMKQRILSYIEHKSDHWCPTPMIIFKELEELNRVRIAIWLQHKMNHQDMGERWARRALLVEEMVKIFNDLDIKYRLYPIDINVCSMPTMASDRLTPN